MRTSKKLITMEHYNNNYVKIIILALIITITNNLVALAITPQAFNYQAVLRNSFGQILESQDVNVGIAIKQGTVDGTSVFDEVHTTETNEFGLVNLVIGEIESASFEAIDWSDGPFYLEVSVNGLVMGTSQLLSVPYALYAENAGNNIWDESGSDIFYPGGNVGIGADFPPAGQLGIATNSTTSFPHIHLLEEDEDYARILFMNESNTSNWQLAGLTSTTNADARFNIYHNTLGDLLTVSGAENGRVGIRALDPTHTMEIAHGSFGASNISHGLKIRNRGNNNNQWVLYTYNNSGNFGLFHNNVLMGNFVSATGAYATASDARIKENIAESGDVLSGVMQLKPRKYSYKSNESSRRTMGLFAQEVEPYFPEFVYRTGEDAKGYALDYAGMSVLAIKAIQEQQKEIDLLKSRLELLEQKLTNLPENKE